MSTSEGYGEYECPYCGKVFHQKRKYNGHIGGAHRRGITMSQKISVCKKCGSALKKDVNWAEWAYKQGNLICNDCKRIMNQESYYRNREKRKQRKLEQKDDRN